MGETAERNHDRRHPSKYFSTFRSLPLTAEQDAEVRHYIKKKCSTVCRGTRQSWQPCFTTCWLLQAATTKAPTSPSTTPGQSRSAHQLQSTRAWTPSRQAR